MKLSSSGQGLQGHNLPAFSPNLPSVMAANVHVVRSRDESRESEVGDLRNGSRDRILLWPVSRPWLTWESQPALLSSWHVNARSS